MPIGHHWSSIASGRPKHIVLDACSGARYPRTPPPLPGLERAEAWDTRWPRPRCAHARPVESSPCALCSEWGMRHGGHWNSNLVLLYVCEHVSGRQSFHRLLKSNSVVNGGHAE